MTTLTITIADDRAKMLQELASRLKVAPEELLRVSLEDLLATPDDEFEKVAHYVLQKNAEVYRRLA
jgi:predicted transcriptional regulator